ncbi:hypothetical protein V8E53_014504 [Lactarius tabidus]
MWAAVSVQNVPASEQRIAGLPTRRVEGRVVWACKAHVHQADDERSYWGDAQLGALLAKVKFSLSNKYFYTIPYINAQRTDAWDNGILRGETRRRTCGQLRFRSLEGDIDEFAWLAKNDHFPQGFPGTSRAVTEPKDPRRRKRSLKEIPGDTLNLSCVSNNSDSSQSATPPRRPTLSATFPPPTSAMPSDFPPDLPPDDIPKSPLLAYSLTPDIDDVCETFTGTVQDPRNPPARARGVSAPAAATSDQPPGPPNSFSELPPSQLSGCEAPLSPSAPSSSVSSHAISRLRLLSTNDPSIRSVPLTRITFRNSLLHASYGQLYPLQVKGMGTRRACRCLATLCCASE